MAEKHLFLILIFFTFSCLWGNSFAELDSPPTTTKPYRLIALSEEESFWIPEKVIDYLSGTGLNFIDITDHQDVDPKLAPKSLLAIPSEPTHQSVVQPLLNQISPQNFESNLRTLTSFNNRYYTSSTGLDSANWIFDQVSAIAANRSYITVTKFTHSWLQPSVIARINAFTSSKDLVILGAHQDSIAPGMPTGRAPGADDDGTGSMAILEIFRILVQNNFMPQNPLEFQWYAAEEVGLLGSQAIAQDYQSRSISIRSMMELDMAGYNGKESNVCLITDYTDAATNAFIRQLVDEYLTIPWVNGACGYGCSDHASFNRYGYPSSFPFEASPSATSPYIHTANDVIDYVSIEHAVEFIKLGLSFAVELSYL